MAGGKDRQPHSENQRSIRSDFGAPAKPAPRLQKEHRPQAEGFFFRLRVAERQGDRERAMTQRGLETWRQGTRETEGQ